MKLDFLLSRRSFGVLITAVSLLVHTSTSFAQAPRPVSTGKGGAAATISQQASESAIQILNQGGNAVDAAVAAAATLGVTDPFSCGIGGGGFMVVYLAKDKRVITVDHREAAPAAFTPNAFQTNGTAIDHETAVASGMSVGVPGTVRGWEEALRRYGTMSFKQVLAPAIAVAEKGFTVKSNFHRLTQENVAKFNLFHSSRALYLRDGKAVPVGTVLRNPDMAKAYREIAQHGAKAFYEGNIARAIVQTVNQPPVVQQAVRPGAMTMADLANYEARIRQPLHSTYRGYDLYGMAPPSSGGTTVFAALNILEGYDLASMPRTQVEHLYIEAAKRAFADRNAYLGDPEFVDVPVTGLLSKEYAAQRRADINPQQASSGPVAEGDPFAFQNDPSVPLRPQTGRPRTEGEHTTHLTVSDKEGNIVAYTFTIESWGGNGMVVPGYGFLLNNEMTDFDFSGPHPNIPEAGKRPRSSMSPTLAFKNGKPAFSIGSPGGATIITTVLQSIVNHIDLGMPMDQAINAPRLFEHNGQATAVEPGFADSEQGRALRAMGHRWANNPREIGAANAIVFHSDGRVTAVSEGQRHGIGTGLVQYPEQP